MGTIGSGSDISSIPSKKSKKYNEKSGTANFVDDDLTELPSATSNKKRKKRGSRKLEEVDDELEKIKPKDPALMTARQRSIYYGSPSTSTPALCLPTGYKKQVMSPEAIQKAAIQSQKRKQLAAEKREKVKQKTVDRLLKRQDLKATTAAKPKPTTSTVPSIVYIQNNNGTTLTFPENVEFPLRPQKIISYPPVKYCSMGCGNLRKYSCSKTGAALCSLSCYKQNIVKRNEINLDAPVLL